MIRVNLSQKCLSWLFQGLLFWGLIFGALAAQAKRIIIPLDQVKTATLRDEDLAASLSHQQSLDYQNYPEILELQQRIAGLVEHIEIEGDTQRPLILVIEDDMTLNASYQKSLSGPDVLRINLGLVAALSNDDELAFVLGHELEHGNSVINDLERMENPFRSFHYGLREEGRLHLLQRVAENEVDLKSTVNRLLNKGLNPSAARTALQKLLELGSGRGMSHTSTNSRIDAVDALLLALKRKLGKQFQNSDVQNNVLTQELKQWMKSEDFKAKRQQKLNLLIDELESKVSELESLIKLGPEKISADPNLNEQVERLSSEVKRSLENNTYLIHQSFKHVLSDVEILQWQVRFQQRIVERLGSVRQALLENKWSSVMQNYKVLLDVSLYSGSTHLDVDNWENSLMRSYEKYYRLVEKQRIIKQRLATGDWVTREIHDDTSDPQTARLQLERLPQKINEAWDAYEEEARLWYDVGSNPKQFHNRVHKAVIDRQGFGEVKPELREFFQEIRLRETHLGPLRVQIAEFAGNLGLSHDRLIIAQPLLMMGSNRNLIEKVSDSATPEQAREILKTYVHQMTEQFRIYATMETSELQDLVGSYYRQAESSFVVQEEQYINHLFTSVVESLERFVPRNPTKKDLTLEDPEVLEAHDTVLQLLGVFQTKHGLTVDLEPFPGVAPFSTGYGSRVNHLKVNKPFYESQQVKNYIARQQEIFTGRFSDPTKILKLEISSAASANREFDPADMKTFVAKHFENWIKEIKEYFSGDGPVFPMDLTKALEHATVADADTINIREREMWKELESRVFQAQIVQHYFSLGLHDPLGSGKIYHDFLSFIVDLEKNGDTKTKEFFQNSFGIHGFLLFAYRSNMSHEDLAFFLNRLSDYIGYDSQYEIHSESAMTQREIISDYMRGFDYSLLDAEISQLTTDAAFLTSAKPKGAFGDKYKNSIEEQTKREKDRKERQLMDPYRRQALKIIRSNPSVETFRKLFKDIDLRFTYTQRGESIKAIPEAKLSPDEKALMIMGYVQHMKSKKPNGELDQYERSDVSFLLRDYLPLETYKELRVLGPEIVPQFIQMMMTSMNPDPVRDNIFHSYLENIRSSGGNLDYFLNPIWVQGFFYDHYRVEFAIWQLDHLYGLNAQKQQLKAGNSPLPQKNQIRQLIKDILKFVDSQFPTHSMAKEEVLNRVEETLYTSQAETRYILDYRANTENWTDTGNLIGFDMPDFLRENMKSAEDKFQFIEYLLNIRAKIPEFVNREYDKVYKRWSRNHRTKEEIKFEAKRALEKAEIVISSMKALFSNQATGTQAVILSQLLGMGEDEILGDPVYLQKTMNLILGQHSDNFVVKAIFESYLHSAPPEQYKHLISYILASKHLKDGSSNQSLKPIFEAMGAFGIKAAQFLYSSGLLNAEMAEDLKDFLSAASPPTRFEMVHFLEKAFGKDLKGITHLGSLLGSGSINFVVEVMFEKNGEPSTRVVRVRRPFLEGLNENENEIWVNVIERLQKRLTEGEELSNEDRQLLADASSIINEARRQAFATLKEGGRELDLRHERELEELMTSYERVASDPALPGWSIEPIRHDKELQQQIPEELQTVYSVYEKIDHTPLEKIGNPQVRKALASEILKTELSALFEHGVFDPDGHLGNWMINMKNKRLVRIDYAQALILSKKVRQAFQHVFFELVSTEPDFSNKVMAERLLELIELPEGVTLNASDLTGLTTNFRAGAGDFHQRLFELRKSINDHLRNKTRTLGADQEVQFSEEMRAAFSSLAKMRKLQEELGDLEFFKEFNRYNTKMSKQSLALKAWSAFESVKNWALGSDESETVSELLHVDNPTLNTSPLNHDDVAETQREEYTRDILKEDVIPQGQGKSHRADRLGITEIAEDHVKLTLDQSIQVRPSDEVLLISRKVFEALPIGTVLHSYHKKDGKRLTVIVGVQADGRVEDWKGFVTYGVLKSDFERLGGPERVKVLAANLTEEELSDNVVVKGKNDTQLVLLTQEQYEALPDGTFLYHEYAGRFLKGNPEVEITPYHGNPMFLSVGIPNRAQKGFEEVGVDFTGILNKPVPACASLLRNLDPLPQTSTPAE